jgi:hypothetical protein
MSLVSKKKKWHTIYVAVSLLRLTPVTLGNSALSPHFFSLPDRTPKEKPTTNFYFVCHRYASQRPVHKLLLMFFLYYWFGLPAVNIRFHAMEEVAAINHFLAVTSGGKGDNIFNGRKYKDLEVQRQP